MKSGWGNGMVRLYIAVLNIYKLGLISPLPSADTSSPQAWSASLAIDLSEYLDWKPAE